MTCVNITGALFEPLLAEIRAAAPFVGKLDIRRQARARTQEGGLGLPSAWRAAAAGAGAGAGAGGPQEFDEEEAEAAEEAAGDRRRR